MSRIGLRILTVPENVNVTVNGNIVSVKGPKGELSTEINSNLTVSVQDSELKIERKNENVKNFHGTANANIKNMIVGVSEGFEKKLECIGVGYRFTLKGNDLVISAGYSHPVELANPAGLTVDAISNTEISVKGIDKWAVGEFAAKIRDVRRPEPYKGKGIRYKDEVVRRKEGKKAA